MITVLIVFMIFQLLLLFDSDIASYNVTFLEGDLHSSKCGKPQAYILDQFQ